VQPVERRPLLVHKFGGRRFEDHDLDITVLPELVAYRTLVVDCAKALWRRRHPDRERLPANYEESIVLSFSRVEGGSVAVPIERKIFPGEQARLWQERDEVDEAVSLVADTVDAASADRPLPPQFPKEALSAFEFYGRTLRADEWFEQIPTGRTVPARYTIATRERLIAWAMQRYEDSIDVIGAVIMAKVMPPRFAIRVSEESPAIEAPFEPSAEAAILEALSHYRSAKVRVRGRGSFTAAGQLVRIARVDDVQALAGGELEFDRSARPILAVIRGIMSDVPDEQLATIPQSGDIDRIVYGGSDKAR
jgi:hypothetical protein